MARRRIAMLFRSILSDYKQTIRSKTSLRFNTKFPRSFVKLVLSWFHHVLKNTTDTPSSRTPGCISKNALFQYNQRFRQIRLAQKLTMGKFIRRASWPHHSGNSIPRLHRKGTALAGVGIELATKRHWCCSVNHWTRNTVSCNVNFWFSG